MYSRWLWGEIPSIMRQQFVHLWIQWHSKICFACASLERILCGQTSWIFHRLHRPKITNEKEIFRMIFLSTLKIVCNLNFAHIDASMQKIFRRSILFRFGYVNDVSRRFILFGTFRWSCLFIHSHFAFIEQAIRVFLYQKYDFFFLCLFHE